MREQEQKMVRVRVAVLVGEQGQFLAAGTSEEPEAEVIDAIYQCPDFQPTGQRRLHFLEASLPLPVASTVEAEVAEGAPQ